MGTTSRQRSPSSASTLLLSSMLYSQSQTDDMKSLGEQIIMQAALQCGATEPMINIGWKGDRIVVTVDVHKDENYVEDEDLDVWMDDDSSDLDEVLDDNMIDWEEEDENIIYDEDIELEELDEDDSLEEEFNEDDFDPIPSESSPGKINLSLIARTINELLAADGEDSPAFQIAKLHEIEVANPAFDNVLRGKLMFENYKGFDVIVDHWEVPKEKKKKKKNSKAQKSDGANNDSNGGEMEEVVESPTEEQKKLKITEGKLVGRDYDKEVTMINVKGRVVKIKNVMIECVSLPKAKREKGVK